MKRTSIMSFTVLLILVLLSGCAKDNQHDQTNENVSPKISEVVENETNQVVESESDKIEKLEILEKLKEDDYTNELKDINIEFVEFEGNKEILITAKLIEDDNVGFSIIKQYPLKAWENLVDSTIHYYDYYGMNEIPSRYIKNYILLGEPKANRIKHASGLFEDTDLRFMFNPLNKNTLQISEKVLDYEYTKISEGVHRIKATKIYRVDVIEGEYTFESNYNFNSYDGFLYEVHDTFKLLDSDVRINADKDELHQGLKANPTSPNTTVESYIEKVLKIEDYSEYKIENVENSQIKYKDSSSMYKNMISSVKSECELVVIKDGIEIERVPIYLRVYGDETIELNGKPTLNNVIYYFSVIENRE